MHYAAEITCTQRIHRSQASNAGGKDGKETQGFGRQCHGGCRGCRHVPDHVAPNRKSEPSVTMGAWCNAIATLGMELHLQDHEAAQPTPAAQPGWWPVRVALADYPQRKALAWQVHGTDHLTPVEAFDIYERNARHMDMASMSSQELALWQALQQAFGKRAAHV